MNRHGGAVEPDQGPGSEGCNPLNMSIEAEVVIEQMKQQHHTDLSHLSLELEDKVRHYEKQQDHTRVTCRKKQEAMKEKYEQGMYTLEKQISDLQSEIADLQGLAAVLREAHHKASCRQEEEKNNCKWCLMRKDSASGGAVARA